MASFGRVSECLIGDIHLRVKFMQLKFYSYFMNFSVAYSSNAVSSQSHSSSLQQLQNKYANISKLHFEIRFFKFSALWKKALHILHCSLFSYQILSSYLF